MICAHCGKEIPDNSVFCSYCGKSIYEAKEQINTDSSENRMEEAQTLAKEYNPNDNPEANSTYGASGQTHEYQNLGGFLAFTTYGSMIGGICLLIMAFINIISFMQVQSLMKGVSGTTAGRAVGGALGGTFVITLIVYVVAAVLCFRFYSMLKEKDTNFLHFYEMVMIVAVIALIITTFISMGIVSSTYGSYAKYVTPSIFAESMKSLVSGLIGFIIWLMYFKNSVRVRTYFGTDEYIKNSIFLKNVTPPTPAVPDPVRQEGVEPVQQEVNQVSIENVKAEPDEESLLDKYNNYRE